MNFALDLPPDSGKYNKWSETVQDTLDIYLSGCILVHLPRRDPFETLVD